MRKDGEHFQNRISSLETGQAVRGMQSLWLALTNVIQGLHEPLLQLNSRALPITYMAGQNLACSVCGKSNYSVPPFPHDGSNLTALQEALQEKKKKKEETWVRKVK